MKIIILLILLFFGFGVANKKSPHGVKFDIDCSKCHTETDWKVDQSKMTFNHNSTNFRLDGQHAGVNCRSCHPTLVFSEAKSECSDCHQDMHNQTVGFDCERCHSTSTWIINNTRDIHQNSRFPLLGVHSMTDCIGCHPSASKLQFKTLGIDCYNCHSDNYRATTTPNHIQAGYSTNCIECHNEKSYEWTAAGFNHDFFPLTKGHAITECIQCHYTGTFGKIPANCIDCHDGDYSRATNPNHVQSGFSTNCTDCHTTDPGWKPAAYKQHDSQDFPIYSGKHNNQWKDCSDCHQDNGNYSSFTCLECHEHNKTSMDARHRGRSGYSYQSNACYNCHPRGRAED